MVPALGPEPVQGQVRVPGTELAQARELVRGPELEWELERALGLVLGPEQVEVLDKTDGKRSVVEQLHKKDEQSKTSREEKSKEPDCQR